MITEQDNLCYCKLQYVKGHRTLNGTHGGAHFCQATMEKNFLSMLSL